MRKVQLLVVESHRLLREAIARIIHRYADFGLVALCEDGTAALALESHAKPDIVLLALGSGNGDGLALVAAVRQRFAAAKLIVMDLLPVEAHLLEFVKAGVSGFILRDATPEDFVSAIRSVARGESVLPPVLTRTIFSQIGKPGLHRAYRSTVREVPMSPRQREIIGLIRDGMSNKEIAQRLHIAVDTVKTHVHDILEKLALHSRLQIAAYAARRARAEERSGIALDPEEAEVVL